METILENIPTGVISLDVRRRSGAREFGGARRFWAIMRERRGHLTDLLGEEACALGAASDAAVVAHGRGVARN